MEPNWYIPVDEPCIVNVKQVLATNLELSAIKNTSDLPRNLSKNVRKKVMDSGAMKLSDEEYEMMKAESECRDEIKF